LEGDREAQVNLAIAYHDGLGTPKNLAEYIRWTKKAAGKRDSKGQFNLGLAYFEGDGPPKNLRLARIWLERAAEKGNKNAARLLKSPNP
jgi:TPR repeat protein